MKKYLFLGVLFLMSCGNQMMNLSIPKTKIVSVYFHEYNSYTVCVKNGNNLTMVRLPTTYKTKVKLISDVKDNESMWYKCDIRSSRITDYEEGKGCEIHIKSVDSINTAGWNHGKFGLGTTTRIQ